MGPLISLALGLVPGLARWLSGEAADKTTAAINHAIQVESGTDDPVVAAATIQNDPAVASRLRVQLAQIVAEQETSAHLADLSALTASINNAVSTQCQAAPLSGHKSALAWSAPVISGIVLLTFAAVMTFVLTRSVPTGSETMANMLLGTLSAMATSVVSYWVGSSAGSARKDEQIAQTVRAATTS